MANNYFQFKQFTVHQDRCAMKVTTDGCLFGAWVAGILKQHASTINNCLEIGTGTGLLPLMIAQQLPLSIDTIEIEEDAAKQAGENIASTPWKDHINIIHADAKEYAYLHQYDYIVSNPPFYENEWEAPDLKKNMAHHSESLLLSDLLAVIKHQLKPGGNFYLLLPYKREAAIRKLFSANEFSIARLALVRQSINHDYFRIMLEGKNLSDNSMDIKIQELSIRDASNNYTPDFISLLKEYYLYL